MLPSSFLLSLISFSLWHYKFILFNPYTGFQQVYRLCGFSIFKPKETQFFVDVITTTIRDRIAKGDSSRNDLIDMMIKAMKEETSEKEEEKSRDQFDLDSELQNHQKTKKKEFDEVTIVATAMLMLIAGTHWFLIKSQSYKTFLFVYAVVSVTYNCYTLPLLSPIFCHILQTLKLNSNKWNMSANKFWRD